MRKTQEHPRMLFFLSCIGFYIGIFYGSDGADISYDILGIILPMILILSIGVRHILHIIIILGICLTGYTISIGRYNAHQSSIDHIYPHTELKQYISGTIDKKLYKTELNQAYRLYIANFDNISTGSGDIAKIGKNIIVELPENLDVTLGETIGFTGKIQPIYRGGNLNGFEKYAFFHRISGKASPSSFERITEGTTGILSGLTGKLEKKIFTGFPHDTAGIILGMTIGNIELMSKDTQDEFRDSGISHILVVSGSNITFLIVLIGGLLKYLPINRNTRIGIIIIFVGIYSTLVGWDVPVVRSTIMGLLGYYAMEYGNKLSSIALLMGVASIFLIYSPLSLVYDPAFGLSFMATMSIILFYIPLNKKLGEYILPGWISSIIALSTVASVGTIPITLYHFGSISLGGIFANIFIATIVGWILFFSVWYMLLGFLGSYFLYILGYLIYIPVMYIIYIAAFFSTWGAINPSDSIKNIIIIVFIAFFILDILREERIITCPKDQKKYDSP